MAPGRRRNATYAQITPRAAYAPDYTRGIDSFIVVIPYLRVESHPRRRNAPP